MNDIAEWDDKLVRERHSREIGDDTLLYPLRRERTTRLKGADPAVRLILHRVKGGDVDAADRNGALQKVAFAPAGVAYLAPELAQFDIDLLRIIK